LQEQVADLLLFGQSHDHTQQVLAQLAEAEQALEKPLNAGNISKD
jgi:ATP-binding cassette subfamily F protein uup